MSFKKCNIQDRFQMVGLDSVVTQDDKGDGARPEVFSGFS